jgi:hypothetical protein
MKKTDQSPQTSITTTKALKQVNKMIRRLKKHRDYTTNPHRISSLRAAFNNASDRLKILQHLLMDRAS